MVISYSSISKTIFIDFDQIQIKLKDHAKNFANNLEIILMIVYSGNMSIGLTSNHNKPTKAS